MKVQVFAVFAMIAGSIKGQAPGSRNQMLNGMTPNQGNQMMPSQGPKMMPTQAPKMMPGQGPQTMPSQLSQMMPNQGSQMISGQGSQTMPAQSTQMMPNYMGPIAYHLYPQNNNMYSNNYMPQNGAYGRQQGANQGEQSAMSWMPYFFGGDKGRRFAMMNMMMNPKQGGMSRMAPLLFIDGAMEGEMWPLMAMAGNRRNTVNPLMMVAADGMM